MKRHYIVGVIAGVGAIGFTIRSILSANFIDAAINFILLSGVAVSTFYKEKLPTKWSQPIIPFWLFTAVVSLSLLGLLILNNLR